VTEIPRRRLTDAHDHREARRDRFWTIAAIVIGALLTVSLLTTTVVSIENHLLGDSNRSLLTNYGIEQANLVAAGIEQEAFALYLVGVLNTNCANLSLIETNLGITTGPPCPAIPNFAPLPGTTKPKK
jgi:hypothetical protein